MKVIYPPTSLSIVKMYPRVPKVFLAGSIELGTAIDWQTELIKHINETYKCQILVFNPRREEQVTWLQSINDEKFVEQVTWEQDALNMSDIIVLCFDPNTKSPISLLELGLFAGRTPEKLIVYCPEGFWRKGNVDITCTYYGVKQVGSEHGLQLALKDRIQKMCPFVEKR